MGSFRNSIVWGVLLAGIVAISPVAAHAEDSELFINRVWPNVLLMVDISGSMDEASGSTRIGNLDADGGSNTKMDALWKVTYTLLNADLSIPPGGGGTPTTISCEVREYNGDDSIRAGTPLSNLRYRNCNGGTLPGSAANFHREKRQDRHGDLHLQGNLPRWARNMSFLLPGGDLHLRSLQERKPPIHRVHHRLLLHAAVSFSHLQVRDGRAPNENAQAIGSTYYAGNLTSGDEAQLKARIGYMDFTGTLSPYVANITIRNQIPSTALDQAPFSSPIRYYDIWQSLINNATPQSYTPTAQALVTAKTFFQNAYQFQRTCRPNYAILITDGEDTMGLNSTEDGTTSSPNNAAQRLRHNRVIEKAAALWDNTYKISLFTVGVGIGVPGDTDAYKRESREVLRRAADQLNEQLDSAQVSYVNSNGDNVLKGAGNGRGPGTGVLRHRRDPVVGGSQLHLRYDPRRELHLHLPHRLLRADQRPELPLPGDVPAGTIAGDLVGRAPLLLLHHGSGQPGRCGGTPTISSTTPSRPIARCIRRPSAGAPGHASISERIPGGRTPTGSTNNMLGVASGAARTNVINYVRGTSRSLKLGDIYHSKPVLVGEPSPFFVDSGYSTGVRRSKFPTRRITTGSASCTPEPTTGRSTPFSPAAWVGSSYDHGTGAELFAYIPRLLLPTIKNFVPTPPPPIGIGWIPRRASPMSGYRPTTRTARKIPRNGRPFLSRDCGAGAPGISRSMLPTPTMPTTRRSCGSTRTRASWRIRGPSRTSPR